MKRAVAFVGLRIGIHSVIQTNGTDRQLITQPTAQSIAHVSEAWIFRARQQIPRIEKYCALELSVNRKSVFGIEHGEELASERMATVVVRTEIMLGKATDGAAPAIEKSFIDRQIKGSAL